MRLVVDTNVFVSAALKESSWPGMVVCWVDLRRMFAAEERVTIVERITECRDPKDNKFLELAVNGRADAIISGDADLLELDVFRASRPSGWRKFRNQLYANSGDVIIRRQRPNRRGTGANAPRQRSYVRAINPAERQCRDPAPTCDDGPAQRAQTGDTRMAGGGKNRRQEYQRRARAARSRDLPRIVRRTGQRAAESRHRSGAPAAAEVQPGAQSHRQPGVAGDHQHQPPRSADAGQRAPQRLTPGNAVVPQHHAAQPFRQPRR